MTSNRRLIQNACVITMDPSLGTLERADILIEGEQIRAVAPDIGAEDCEVIDGTAMIAIPGLVDTHRHICWTPFRSIEADYTMFEALANLMFITIPLMRAEDAYIGTYAGGLEALESGITTMVCHCDAINSPEHADEIIRALRETGLRGVFCYAMGGNRKIEPGRLPSMRDLMTPPEWNFEDARRVRETLLPADSGRIRFGTAISELEGFPMELSQRQIEFGRDLGAHLIGVNAGLGSLSGSGNYVKELSDAGLLGPDILIIHGNTLTDEELDLTTEANAAISSTPEIEMGNAIGFPVVGRALARGTQASLGVDVVAFSRGDLFTQMRFALQAERLRRCEELARQGLAAESNKIKAHEMLEIATIGGARAANLDAEVGSLTVGKQADVVLIRTDRLGISPVNDPVKTVVMQANAADVDTVFLAGKPVKRDGKLLNIDLPPILDRLSVSRDYLLAESSQIDKTALIDKLKSKMPLG